MGFRLPAALAGDENEVEMNSDGLQRVAELIGGASLAAGIIAAAGWVFKRATAAAGQEQSVGDLY